MPPPRRLTRRAFVAAACAIALLPACRPALRGVDFAAPRDPFLPDDYVAPETTAGEPVYRLLLVGDAGQPRPDDPTLELVGRWSEALPDRTAVIYLGDNLYPAGLQEGDRERGERVLLQQIDASPARKVFVPGNHDWGFTWNQPHALGVRANQEAFIGEHADRGAEFQPKHGCPGPAPLELVEPGPKLPGGLTVLALDLHWWLLGDEGRPVCEGIEGTSAFVERLREELAAREGENVVVVAHHPIRSGGTHGGYTRGFWQDFGTALFYRFYTVQDLIEPTYREMVRVLSEVLAEHPPVAAVGGHDHSLQVIDGGDAARLVIVSGAATKVSGVTSIEGTLFAHGARGFVVLDFHVGGPSGEGTLLVHVVEARHGEDPVATFALDLAREQAPTEVVPPPPPSRTGG